MKQMLPLSILPSLLIACFWFANVPCAKAGAMPPSAFADERPTFDPLKFYTGHTRSWGVFENTKGEPTERITTETWGRMVNGELRMEQDLYIGSKPRSHRSWRMRRIDAHHFEATANDVIGTVRGEAHGNAFFWSFTLALKPGNPLSMSA